ncbi:MAG TPA: DUF4337 family protein [Opitutus sp.]|nr:DUF4337 family protein [Opitutus sp.]
MKIKIPEVITSTLPANRWGKILGATPVVMTVIATLLAGLANSEMTKSQYDRSLAAQQQSKAGDQWGFFQAKRLRSAIQLGSLDVIALTTAAPAIDAAGLRALAATLDHPADVVSALDLLLAAALNPLLLAAKPELVASALQATEERSRAFDALLQPVVTNGDRLGDELDPVTTRHAALARDFARLRLRYSAMRYDAEARLNQQIAAIHELQVNQSNLSSERHRRRSQHFFLGMLGAQAAVIISTLAMAARQRNLLWGLAALAGVGAALFAAYVYLYL